MSNTNSSRNKDTKTSNPGGENPATNLPKRWSFIQNDLEKALNTWEELEKSQPALSQEEEQLVKIKSIINQLKDKLDHF